MEVLYPRCAGLDVHQQTVVACARIVTEGKVVQHVETFETTTQGLGRLRDSGSHANTQAAGARDRATHPASPEDLGGRKHQDHRRDQRPAGRERPSAAPSADCRRDRSRATGRTHHGAAQGSARRASRGAARSRSTASPLLAPASPRTDRRPRACRSRSRGADRRIHPAVPGGGRTARHDPRRELDRGPRDPGGDRRRHGPLPHGRAPDLWAGFCPRNDESAGKRRSTRVRKGAPWLKTTLVQAAWAAVRKKGSSLRAQFLRIKARRGPMKAILAVAASMLTAAYHMLRTGAVYEDLGECYFDARDRLKLVRRLVRRLGDLGVQVQVTEAAA